MKRIKLVKLLNTNHSFLTLPLIASVPLVVSSCSELPVGPINKEQQTQLISSAIAKNLVLDNWLSSTYNSLYIKYILKINESEKIEKLNNTLNYFYENLEWAPVVDKKYADEVLFPSEKREEFVNQFQEAYKFYISFCSSIKSSDSSSVLPSLYFINKKWEWIKEKYKPLSKITSSTYPNKELSLTDFNPTSNYTGLDLNSSIINDDYKILVSTRGTLVFQNIMKLLLSKMYFVQNDENLIKNGTNFSKLVKNEASVSYYNTRSYIGENNNFANFLLKKYLVENNARLKWSYSNSSYSTETESKSIISTIDDFNNLSTTQETTLKKELAPNFLEDISLLQAFDSLNIQSDTDNNGDLSNDIEIIKSFGNVMGGILTNNTNSILGFDNNENETKLFRFEEIKAIKKANEINKTNNNILMIPSINIKNNPSIQTLTINDLDVSWDGQVGQFDSNSKTFSLSSTINQKITINSLSFASSEINSKEVKISFTYSFNYLAEDYKFDYSFTISNWDDKGNLKQKNIFAKPFKFSISSIDQIGIKLFDDSGKALGVNYYLRLLPLFEQSDIRIINNKYFLNGRFTFKNTPWETVEQQTKLAYFLVLSDNKVLNQIQNFYLFNNYNIQSNVSEIKSIISELGLSEKTNEDRMEEGII